LAVGVLTAAPAHAAWGINNGTYAARFRVGPGPAPRRAKSRSQVTVVVSPVSNPVESPRPWGPPRPCAVKAR